MSCAENCYYCSYTEQTGEGISILLSILTRKRLINFVHSFTGIGLDYSMSTSVTLQELGYRRSQQRFTTKSSAPEKFRIATRSTATTHRNVVRRFHCESYKTIANPHSRYWRNCTCLWNYDRENSLLKVNAAGYFHKGFKSFKIRIKITEPISCNILF
jgi:hypothetical protein